MMARILLLSLLASAVSRAADFRYHLIGSTLDVYVGAATETASDIPGLMVNNQLLVSVRTSDDLSHAIMVWVMVRLDDGTRTVRQAIAERGAGTDLVVFRLPLGARRPVELVDIRVDNLRKTYMDVIAPA